MNMMNECTLCPRKCGTDRINSQGFCGAESKAIVARASLHKWEEPCISYKNGAGTVFFSGCNLHCCFCQNNKISNTLFGKEISDEKLAEIFLSLQDMGADNIDLVTPTHFVPNIINALDMIKHKRSIPVVYNCGGYESDSERRKNLKTVTSKMTIHRIIENNRIIMLQMAKNP